MVAGGVFINLRIIYYSQNSQTFDNATSFHSEEMPPPID